MKKAIKQNDNFTYAVIISVFLHSSLIALLLLNALTQEHKIENITISNTVIDAIMVDSKIAEQQQKRQQQHKKDAKHAEKKQQEKQKKQADALQKKLLEQQKQLKFLEKERLQAQEKITKAIEEQKQQAEQQKQAKMAADIAKSEALQAKKIADEAIKKLAQIEAKKQADLATEKKKAFAADKKAQAEKKEAQEIEKLFNNLELSETKKISDQDLVSIIQSDINKKSASTREINDYLGQIDHAIKTKFYSSDLYRDQKCELHIQLARDGLLINITAKSGNPALCQAGIIAAKQANIPPPPNEEVYQIFKDVFLVFKP